MKSQKAKTRTVQLSFQLYTSVHSNFHLSYIPGPIIESTQTQFQTLSNSTYELILLVHEKSKSKDSNPNPISALSERPFQFSIPVPSHYHNFNLTSITVKRPMFHLPANCQILILNPQFFPDQH